MAARPADGASRPRPRPVGDAAENPSTGSTGGRRSGDGTVRRTGSDAPRSGSTDSRLRGRNPRRSPGRGLARQQAPQSQQVVAAAGSAVVSAARVGRLLGRTGWRLAKQLPGVGAVESQAQRLGHALGAEFGRLLDMPQSVFSGMSPDEARAVALIHDSADDAEPLRSAMGELLDRSAERDGTRSQDYLFGTIVSQLVPDEARILAALAGGGPFAAVDIVSRNSSRVELANMSTVGAAAGISLVRNTGTYLTRLAGLGLIEFHSPTDDLDSQFDALRDDSSVQRAKSTLDKARTVRKSVMLSPLGQQFWDACAPAQGRVARRPR